MERLTNPIITGIRTLSVDNYDDRWDKRDQRLIEEIAGPQIWDFLFEQRHKMREISRAGGNPKDVFPARNEVIDRNVLDSIKYMYAFPDDTSDERLSWFYVNNLRRANKAVRYVIDKAFPRNKNTLDLCSTISEPSMFPSENLSLLAAGGKDTDGKSFYKLVSETSRMHLLADIAGRIVRRRELEGHQDLLGHVQRTLERELFEEKVFGKNEDLIVYACHDEQNAVEWYESGDYPVNRSVSSGHHIKHHSYKVRQLEGIGSVSLFNQRVKETPASIIKSLRVAVDKLAHPEAYKDKGTEIEYIDPLADVYDSMGFQLVTFGSQKQSDLVIERVEEILKRNYGDNIKDIYLKNKTKGRKGQSKDFEFKRLMVQFNHGVTVPMEIFFYTGEQYINSYYQIGEFDEQKQEYTGQAHQVYSLARIADVLDIILPQKIYPIILPGNRNHPEPYYSTPREQLILRTHEIANKLKNENGIAEENDEWMPVSSR